MESPISSVIVHIVMGQTEEQIINYLTFTNPFFFFDMSMTA